MKGSVASFVAASLVALNLLAARPIAAQTGEGPVVLLVTAHPDDEAMFAASVYRITHDLDGVVDLALVTDGSGGFRYSQLAEPIYGLDLTDQEVARRFLPAIRKEELRAAGAIMGIRDYFFLDEYDHAYTENVDTVLHHVWDADRARGRLTEIMARGRYDFVFVHLPVPDFHAHHKAASILALEAAAALPDSLRPVVLGSFIGVEADPDFLGASTFTQLEGFPVTRVAPDLDPFIFDRRTPLSPDGRLDYRIVANWVIAAHKTQGTMQLLVNQGEYERFWFFAVNDPAGLAATRQLFERLSAQANSEQ
ncbi:MAG: PIG-L family deacetylase [Gemmatimonadetes bacterium]|uniref:PIG-L family deacetylase n=1 Tax=Candidatus Kutchimonas denitrificans TaxID=3056748 RepID=A0AAE4ZAD0_9BACT|nr:PIG-L family deacetylase [Gemmatimonadota bacterium]NIR75066.1 PIG-L family deacetylase [Candidatus Kutchimonas denitrificans]NIS02886.1 PIG-L family deacetylase [Gemmatimonadota bacterium]NIT68595.1 PIG-L family deacetylase [Gemmatimonadota bacterium]NIU52855.1 PIG-L family deacetylase [Gemmatimonadota bacterium]